MDAIPLDFFFVLHNLPWWSVPTHSRFKFTRWDSLVPYDLTFCMANRLLNTSNFTLSKECELITWGCMKYFGTRNLADWLLYLASEICIVTSRILHVIILQTPEIHYAKRECYSQKLTFPVLYLLRDFVSQTIVFCTCPLDPVWNELPLAPTVPPVPPGTISSAANIDTTNFFAYV
jgi:hypothetical protein